MKKVLIRTLDTDVVAISVSLFGQLHLWGLWLAIQTGKHLRCLDIHKIAVLLGLEKWKCLTLFHTFNGCDQVLFFAGRGKKAAWNTWNHFGELTISFPSMSLLRKLEDIISHSVSIERLCYCHTISRKGRPLESIPLAWDALMQHVKSALYQASYSWGQSVATN